MTFGQRLLCSLATLSNLAAPTLAGDLIVDPSGRGDAPTIADAMALAQPGDTLIVYPGIYDEPLDITRGVWVWPQQLGTVTIRADVTVRDIPLDEQVLFQGMLIEGGDDDCVVVRGCEGVVHFDQCALLPQGVSVVGVRLQDARRVVLTRTDVEGSDGLLLLSGSTVPRGAPAIDMTSSRLTAWGGTIRGGQGGIIADGAACTATGEPGYAGMRLTSSEAFVAGSTVQAGSGPSFFCFGATSTGFDGGDAVELDAGSSLYSQRASLVPGAGGDGTTPGQSGQVVSGGGSMRLLGGTLQLHQAERYAIDGEDLALTLRGGPGRTARLFAVTGRTPFLFDSFSGGSTPGLGVEFALSSVIGPVGSIPASGELQTAVPIPALPAVAVQATFLATVEEAHGRSLFGAPMPVLGVNKGTVGPDCDLDGVVDLVEIELGTAFDTQPDGRPEDCAADCNGNGVPDRADIAGGTSLDGNGNGLPDECEPPFTIWHVNAAAAPGGDGTVSAPFQNLAAAHLVAASGDVIQLAPGLYTGSANRGLHFVARPVRIEGTGGAGQCVIDLGGAGRAFQFTAAGNTLAASLAGLTLRSGGVALGPTELGGGAVLAEETDMRVESCVFEDNRAGDGGAIRVIGGALEVRRSTFVGNGLLSPAVSDGGAISTRLLTGSMVLEDCRFEGNAGSAVDLYWTGGTVHIARCTFVDNVTDGLWSRAGALLVNQTDFCTVDQCLFAANTGVFTGAMEVRAEQCLVTNSTFVGNRASWTTGMGGAVAFVGSAGSVANCILWDNDAPRGPSITFVPSLEVRHSLVEGGASSIHRGSNLPGPAAVLEAVLDLDPLFSDPLGADGNAATGFDNDYRLLFGSPGIDAGSNALLGLDHTDSDRDLDVLEPAPFDLVGVARRLDDPGTPDTGVGAAPIVDLGPYER